MQMGDYSDLQMKEFIAVTDELLAAYTSFAPTTMIVESVEEPQDEYQEHPMLEECRDLIFKLRAFMEDSAGDYALGVETGMQRAADMIENLVRRHEKGIDFE